jgi:CDP-4-dehydro-6-deoxyglucose reductase
LEFRVRLKQSGREFSVQLGETVLSAAVRARLGLPYSCRSGECGSCKARLVSGAVSGGDGEALTATERAAGFVLLCRAIPDSDLEVLAREAGAGQPVPPVLTLPARVARMERLAHDVMGLWLKLPATLFFDYRAGQYVDLLLPGGRRRSFSLAGRPKPNAELELHVRRVPGGRFTAQVFEKMRPGDFLRLRGPYGTMVWSSDLARPALLIAGGTGLAPAKAMIEQAIADRYARVLCLYRGARARRDLYLSDLAGQWSAALPGFVHVPVLSEPAPEDRWQGRSGNVHEAVLADFPDVTGFEVYAAGPPPMIDAIRRDFARAGLPEEQLHCDAFEFQTD